MSDQAQQQGAQDVQQALPDVVDINDVEQFAHIFGVWHARMLARLRNLRDIPFGTEVSMTDENGKETKVKLKGDGMNGFKAALTAAISELADTPFVVSLDTETKEDGPDAVGTDPSGV